MTPRPPSIGRALAASFRASPPGPADAAAAALARTLAQLLDEQAGLAAAAAAAYDRAQQDGRDELLQALDMLRAKVDRRAVTSDVAPKLLAVLAALKLTPAARSAVVADGTDPRGRADVVTRLRAAHDGRQR